MQQFYKKARITFLCLMLTTFVAVYICTKNSFVELTLLPNTSNTLQWKAEVHTDKSQGGSSSLELLDDKRGLDFNVTLGQQVKYLYAKVNLVFVDKNSEPVLVDLSAFDRIHFSAKCSRENTLSLTLLIFDDRVSKLGKFLSYRAPSAFFSCNPQASIFNIDLTSLSTPEWWFNSYKVDLSRKAYSLSKVAKISFDSTFQSPIGVESNIQINEITLAGRNWFYLYLLAALILPIWGAYGLWLISQYKKALILELQHKIQSNAPYLAYQQLSIEPSRDKDRRAIFDFMTTRYANPDLTLDYMAKEIGVSRTKINDILKSEVGLTYTSYLNKLRLHEATQLLSQKKDMSISDIAFSVGYNNATYFNKVFKEEYNCSPKSYKSLIEGSSNSST